MLRLCHFLGVSPTEAALYSQTMNASHWKWQNQRHQPHGAFGRSSACASTAGVCQELSYTLQASVGRTAGTTHLAAYGAGITREITPREPLTDAPLVARAI